MSPQYLKKPQCRSSVSYCITEKSIWDHGNWSRCPGTQQRPARPSHTMPDTVILLTAIHNPAPLPTPGSMCILSWALVWPTPCPLPSLSDTSLAHCQFRIALCSPSFLRMFSSIPVLTKTQLSPEYCSLGGSFYISHSCVKVASPIHMATSKTALHPSSCPNHWTLEGPIMQIYHPCF